MAVGRGSLERLSEAAKEEIQETVVQEPKKRGRKKKTAEADVQVKAVSEETPGVPATTVKRAAKTKKAEIQAPAEETGKPGAVISRIICELPDYLL